MEQIKTVENQAMSNGINAEMAEALERMKALEKELALTKQENEELKTQATFSGTYFETLQEKHEAEIKAVKEQLTETETKIESTNLEEAMPEEETNLESLSAVKSDAQAEIEAIFNDVMDSDEIQHEQEVNLEALFANEPTVQENVQETSYDLPKFEAEAPEQVINTEVAPDAESLEEAETAAPEIKLEKEEISLAKTTDSLVQHPQLAEALDEKTRLLEAQMKEAEALREIIKEMNMQAEELRAIAVPKKETVAKLPKQSLKEKAEIREKALILKEEYMLKYKKVEAADGSVKYIPRNKTKHKVSTVRGAFSTIATEELPIGERKERLIEAKKEIARLEKEEEKKALMAEQKKLTKLPKKQEAKTKVAASYVQIVKPKSEAEKKAERNNRLKKKKQLKQQLIQNESFAKQVDLKEKSIPYLATRAAAINIVKDMKFVFQNALTSKHKTKNQETNEQDK